MYSTIPATSKTTEIIMVAANFLASNITNLTNLTDSYNQNSYNQYTNQTNQIFNDNICLLSEEKVTGGWCIVSKVIGWIYFAVWSSSFYGQVYENFKNKHVKGLSFDFQFYNLTGFLGYSIYNIWAYINPKIGANGVELNDVLFATHAMAITLVTCTQIYIYYDKTDPNQKISNVAISIVVCIWWGFFIVIFIEQILGMYDPYDHAGKSFAFNSIIYLGFMKAFISLIKYMPQVKLNFDRKSTVGWSIFNIIMDFSGGAFSLIQNLIDTITKCGTVISHNETYLLNIVKYAISILSIFFDIIFMIQHWVIYRKSPEEEKLDRLINSYDDGSPKNTRDSTPNI